MIQWIQSNTNLIYATLFFTGAHILSWFQINSQFVWEWWRDRPFLTCCIYSIPCSLMFLYAARYAYADAGEVWTGRFLAFAASYLVFPLLTWVFLRESMFTPKTLTCVGLSVIIMVVQFAWATGPTK